MTGENAGKNWRELTLAGMQTSDYAAYFRLCRERARHLSVLDIPRRRKIRLALTGSASTDFMKDLLEFALDSLGIESEIFEAPFNTCAYQMMDPASAVAVFGPDVIVVVNAPFNQPEWPEPGASAETVATMAERAAGYWLDLCAAANRNMGCEIVFDNFAPLPWRPTGNLAAKLAADHNTYLAGINRLLGSKAPRWLHISDVAWLAAWHGVSRWIDNRYWHHAKLPVSFDCIVPYIKNTARIVAALYGATRKVLVLDLDNTLWGGVVGDDGVDGIRLGQGTPDGEAFLSFQEYILQLKQRGVLLAVCSKNDAENARAPFREHSEMRLALDDFVSFVANWDPKPDNLASIARTLDLGLDSFVFIDDNPAERELMRMQLPEVLTLEIGNDPAAYPALIDAQGPFESTSVSEEDARRTGQYRENMQRETLRSAVSSYEDYLESLQQRAVIRAFEESRLDRVTQLINKTNQFNLTTLRKSRSEVEALMRDEGCMTTYIRLADRFGDNGVIAVVFGTWSDDALTIDGWLMSCRVLRRDVEKLTCNYLAGLAAAAGKRFLHGVYVPSARNGMVGGLYRELGFEQSGTAADGATTWTLDVGTFVPIPHAITIEES